MTYFSERQQKTAGREWTENEFDKQYEMTRENMVRERKASKRDGEKEGQDGRR